MTDKPELQEIELEITLSIGLLELTNDAGGASKFSFHVSLRWGELESFFQSDDIFDTNEAAHACANSFADEMSVVLGSKEADGDACNKVMDKYNLFRIPKPDFIPDPLALPEGEVIQ